MVKTNPDGLTPRDYVDLALEAGIGSIPAIGGPLATMYFGSKNEKRLKRIERFYQELNQKVDKLKEKIPEPQAGINRDQLMGVLESINDEMETARVQAKRDLFQHLYVNCLKGINQTTWDQEEFFETALSELNTNEIRILLFLHQKPINSSTGNIKAEGIAQELTDGYLFHLVNLGLVRRFLQGITIGNQSSGSEYRYQVTQLGRDFVKCIAF